MRRHPAGVQLSRYVEGELDRGDRKALEVHLLDCARCRRMLQSLTYTVRALASVPVPDAPGLPERVISILRMADPTPSPARARSLGVECREHSPDRSLVAAGIASLRRWPQRARLRLTVPIALLAAAILSLVNQGGMLLAGRIDLRMCVVCGLNFLLPFVALNVVLFAAASSGAGRGRPGAE